MLLVPNHLGWQRSSTTADEEGEERREKDHCDRDGKTNPVNIDDNEDTENEIEVFISKKDIPDRFVLDIRSKDSTVWNR